MKILKGELTDHPRGNISAQNKKAIVIGATGATGTKLVRLLLDSDNWDKVSTISRRPVLNGEKHNKLNEVIIDSSCVPFEPVLTFSQCHNVFTIVLLTSSSLLNLYRVLRLAAC